MRHKISCAVHDPTPGRCDCGAKTDLQLAQEEIERLHRRAAVSDRNEFGEVVFKRPDQYIHSLEEKVKSLRQRVVELEKAMTDLLEWVEPIAGDNWDKDSAAKEERTVLAARAAMEAEK